MSCVDQGQVPCGSGECADSYEDCPEVDFDYTIPDYRHGQQFFSGTPEHETPFGAFTSHWVYDELVEQGRWQPNDYQGFEEEHGDYWGDYDYSDDFNVGDAYQSQANAKLTQIGINNALAGIEGGTYDVDTEQYVVDNEGLAGDRRTSLIDASSRQGEYSVAAEGARRRGGGITSGETNRALGGEYQRSIEDYRKSLYDIASSGGSLDQEFGDTGEAYNSMLSDLETETSGLWGDIYDIEEDYVDDLYGRIDTFLTDESIGWYDPDDLDPGEEGCTPLTEADIEVPGGEYACGSHNDGCGGTLDLGGCSHLGSSYNCVYGYCQADTSDDPPPGGCHTPGNNCRATGCAQGCMCDEASGMCKAWTRIGPDEGSGMVH